MDLHGVHVQEQVSVIAMIGSRRGHRVAFIYRFESFKCAICESRKGTSTRKPRLVHMAGTGGAGGSGLLPLVEPHAVQLQAAALEQVQAQQKLEEKQRRLIVSALLQCDHVQAQSTPPSDNHSKRPQRKRTQRATTSHGLSDVEEDEDDVISGTPPSSATKPTRVTDSRERISIDRCAIFH